MRKISHMITQNSDLYYITYKIIFFIKNKRKLRLTINKSFIISNDKYLWCYRIHDGVSVTNEMKVILF